MYLAVGKVVSGTMPTVPHVFNPTSERFAKALVARIGCGKKRITPWMPHAFLQWFMTLFPENVVERSVSQEVTEILKMDMKKHE
jgi:17beta-estradiol 17-dehydrogenase / very-long-chain 3-oxoacyl-CoA reductase